MISFGIQSAVESVQFTFPVCRTQQGSQQTMTGRILRMLSLNVVAGLQAAGCHVAADDFLTMPACLLCSWLTCTAATAVECHVADGNILPVCSLCSGLRDYCKEERRSNGAINGKSASKRAMGPRRSVLLPVHPLQLLLQVPKSFVWKENTFTCPKRLFLDTFLCTS